MKQHARSMVASIALVVVLTLLIPGPLAGQAPRGVATQGAPFPPPLPAPVSARHDPSTPTYPGCGGQLAPPVNTAYEQQVVDLVNSVRAADSLPPLKRVELLDQAARYHATDMGQDNYFNHDSYDRSGGNLVFVCGWSTRVGGYYPGWTSLAENIAAGYGTPADVMDGWMNSSGHRGNILSTGNWEIGVGYYAGGGDYYSYWVQDFGRRSGIYPLIIDADAATTTSRDVTLYIYGDWQEMRLRNDGGTWSPWQTFQPTVSWTLASGQGTHTVSAELRTGGQTVTSTDSIYLEATGPAHLVYLPMVTR